MLEIHSQLKELLATLSENEQAKSAAIYQNAYIRFRGWVVDAADENPVYSQWAQQYLVDVGDEDGEVVKLHESFEELKADIAAFIKLMERVEGF